MDNFEALLASSQFLPHGFCYLWDRGLVLLHVVSDVCIGLAYFSIPITLLSFVRKRRDLPFHWMFLLFGLFIIACGSTHVMEVWTLWHATYWLSGIVKAITALASVPTAILLVQLVPQALALPSPERLAVVNDELVRRTNELARTNAELEAANEALRQSEDRFRSLFSSNPLPAWVYDTQTLAFLDVNPSAISHYGYSRDEFLAMTIKDIRSPEEVPVVLQAVARLGAHGEDSRVWRVRRHRKKDGTIFDVEGISHPLLYNGRSARFVIALDVTDRKRVEEALRISEATYREDAELLDLTYDAIFVHSLKGEILFWNRGAERLYGWSKQDVRGKTAHLLLHSVFPKPLEEVQQEVLASGSWEGEVEQHARDGQKLIVVSRWSLRTDAAGRPVSILVSNRDITQRKHAENKFRALLEAAPDAMIIVNQLGLIELANAQVEKVFGYAQSELLGKTVETLVPERFRGKHDSHRKGFFHSPKTREMGAGLELFGLRKDGTEFPVEVSLSPLETPDGILVSSAIRDVTDRKRTAEALKASEERLQLAVEAAQLGVWDLDLATDRAFRSLRHDQIFGYDTLQTNWGAEIAFTHVVPEDREHFRSCFAQAFQGTDFFLECRINRADDRSLRWISAQGRVYRDTTNKPIRMMGVVADITDRKQAEEQLERHRAELMRYNAELNAANHELEAFSYSVSHDLRAPLRSIDGFSLALLEDYSDKLDDEGKKHLQRVRIATQRMGALIDDLLSLSRVTRSTIKLEKVNLSAVASEVADKLRESQPARQIEVRIESGLKATADAQLVRIALENLLGNAWKFTAKKRAARVEFGKSRANGSSAYFIRDNGAGFDPAYSERLFGAFQRLHSTSEFPGTGIGLATVQRIVHRHGGRIWAESTVGQGATFYFTLPEAKP